MKRFALFAFLLLAAHAPTAHADFKLEKGDHICILGNTLAERMQHHGWLETFIVSRFPQHELVFRNLGFSGDEVNPGKRLRSMAFGTPDEWLAGVAAIPQPKKLATLEFVQENRFEHANTKADVIFAFFGYNESFGGEKELPAFKKDLEAWIKHSLGQKYNGESAPRIVLFSPIAHEDLKNADLPDGKENNARLKMYTEAMAEVAEANKVTFVNIFASTLASYGKGGPYTINGIHLNEAGDKLVAEIAVRELLGSVSYTGLNEGNLRKAINEKNWYWFHRYRTTDGYSTYGDRAFLTFKGGGIKRTITKDGNKVETDVLPANYETLQRELHILDVMTANRDKAVWELAQGRSPKVDDSNAPLFMDALTNKPGKGPEGAHNYISGQDGIAKMKIGKNLKVNLFADESMFKGQVVNTQQMSFDTKGRLWITAWPSYPHWKPKDPMNDKLLIIEDTDGDGKADKLTEFVSDIHNPTGFEFYNGGVIVACQPDIWFLKDTDGDDKADVRERILHGFDSADTHHAINSFVFDNGGGLYFQEGIFHRVQVETPWDRALRLVDGGVYRFEPRTWKVAAYIPHGFPNPHGHVFDRWGNDFVTDGTGATTYSGAPFSVHSYFPQRRGGPPKLYNQRTRPCPATEIVSSRHFPEDMQGNLLVQNVIGVLGILNYKITEKDSAHTGVEAEALIANSEDQNFRPTDLEIAPDGSLYFTDWHNSIIGHMQHNLRDNSRDHAHGRVYRLTYEGRPLLTPKKIDGEPVEKLVALLAEYEDRVRYRAKIELSERPTKEVIAEVNKWAAGLDKADKEYEHHMMEALWVHQWHNVVNEELLNTMLAAKDHNARAAAIRVLQHWRDRVKDPLATLAKLVKDEHPRVRLEAVRACSFFQTSKAAEIALEAANLPMDKTLEYTLNETMKTLKAFK